MKTQNIDNAPEWLMQLCERLAEGQRPSDGEQFLSNMRHSVHAGIDLESVRKQFCEFLIKENENVLTKTLEHVRCLAIDEDIKEDIITALRNACSPRPAVATDEALETFSAESQAWAYASKAWSQAWGEKKAWTIRSAAWHARHAIWFTMWPAAWSTAVAAWYTAYAVTANMHATNSTDSVDSTMVSAYVKMADELLRLLKTNTEK